MLIFDQLKSQEKFSPIEKQLADFFLHAGDDIQNQSSRSIAKQNFTTASTVTRFCQKIGFTGFTSFKENFLKELYLLHGNSVDTNYPITRHEQEYTLYQRASQLYIQAINAVIRLNSNERIRKIVRILDNANTIVISSMGISGYLIEGFKDEMLRLGKNVIIERSADNAFYRATYCDQSTVFILLSYSGENSLILRVAKKIRLRHLTGISVSAYGGNSLSDMLQYNLFVSPVENLVENQENINYNIALTFLFDVLYMNLFNRDIHENTTNRISVSRAFQEIRGKKN